MKKIQFQFEYNRYESISELNDIRQKLIQKSIEAAEKAYAPYSNFRVGASVLLDNSEIISGNNQENASYPVGICAERTLLSYVHANFPNQKKKILAVSVLDTDKEVSPCGLCRQTILEYESLQKQNIEILLSNRSGNVLQISSGSQLLPLNFNQDMLI
ncbi:MAG: cytidine deaminase [Weeksellaceae bacterium]|jgi:cytidine deaminase|nr:cytidine deaminase [Weeksellaceae bacterium]MDX9705531.1 cytidine deaminase [Weeksellaceae bacterium]